MEVGPVETIETEEYHTSKIDGYKDRYLLEYPESGVMGPLLIYLHTGLADADQGFCDDNIWCAHRLKNEVAKRRGVYVSPDYRGDSWMNAAAEADLEDLISELKRRFGTGKTVLTGTSMGGTSALIFASHHPDVVDGVIALCPAVDVRRLWMEFKGREELIYPAIAKSITEAYGGTPDEAPQEYSYRSAMEQVDHLTMPLIIVHGDEDDILPISHSLDIVDALKERGRQFRYDIISGGGHNSPMISTPWDEYLDFVLRDDGT